MLDLLFIFHSLTDLLHLYSDGDLWFRYSRKYVLKFLFNLYEVLNSYLS